MSVAVAASPTAPGIDRDGGGATRTLRVVAAWLWKGLRNRSGAKNAAPIAVDPDPYGYASVVTRAPSARQRPTSPSTQSMCRPDVELMWQ